VDPNEDPIVLREIRGLGYRLTGLFVPHGPDWIARAVSVPDGHDALITVGPDRRYRIYEGVGRERSLPPH
jgi:hypothetical protein